MTEDFGAYYPAAADHKPYQDNMAGWRHQVMAERGYVSGLAELPEVSEELDESLDVGTPAQGVHPLTEEVLAHSREVPVTPRVRETVPFESPQALREAAEGALETRPQEPIVESLSTTLDAPEGGSFDPAEHNTTRVLYHLKSASLTEVTRVLAAERAGKARKGILNQTDDLLAKARRRQKN